MKAFLVRINENLNWRELITQASIQHPHHQINDQNFNFKIGGDIFDENLYLFGAPGIIYIRDALISMDKEDLEPVNCRYLLSFLSQHSASRIEGLRRDDLIVSYETWIDTRKNEKFEYVPVAGNWFDHGYTDLLWTGKKVAENHNYKFLVRQKMPC